MTGLRVPFFIAALICIVLTIVIETGTALPGILPTRPLAASNFALPGTSPDALKVKTALDTVNREQPGTLTQLGKQSRPPGLSITNMALLDGIVLFTVLLMGLALLLPERIQGRLQGIGTLIFSLLLLLGAIVLILIALGLLILMVSLLLAVPFGTITYLVIYGSFDRATTDVILALLMGLKIVFVVCLFLTQQRFFENRGLVLLLLTSLLGNVIISLLLGIVPGFLVSITDAIAALIVLILSAIWAIFLLVGSLISIIKVLRLDRASGKVRSAN